MVGRKHHVVVLVVVAFVMAGCEYAGLLRPSVLKQLNPDVVRLLNELPNVDEPNKAIIARLFAHGGLSHAEVSADGVMRDTIRVPENQFIWQPAIVVMPQAGDSSSRSPTTTRIFTSRSCPVMVTAKCLSYP